MGLSYEHIIDRLKMPRSTFYDYLKQIMQEDEEHMLEQQNHGLASAIALAKEKLMRSWLNLHTIAHTNSYEAKDRIAAELASDEIVIKILRIEAEQSAIATNKDLIEIEENTIKRGLPPSDLIQGHNIVIEAQLQEPDNTDNSSDSTQKAKDSDDRRPQEEVF
jgi:hypothetical protein